MGRAEDMQKLSPVENAAVGIAAGAIEVTILQPMLYCKNAVQQGLKLSLDPRVLYRGLAVSVVNMSILTGLQFPLAGAVTKALTGGEKRRLTDGELITSGFIGGALSGIACGPMELVLIQQQRFGGSMISTPARVASSFGVGSAGLFRGLTMAMGREGLFTAGYMGLGPALGRALNEDYGLSTGVAKAVGSVGAGVCAATLSHPMDTIKTCMQGDIEQKSYTSLLGTAKKLYAEEGGLGRFFKGWSWRTGRMICAVFIMGECKNRLSPLFFPDYFTSEE